MFRFRLTRLLAYRHLREALSEQKLLQQQQQLQQAEATLARLHNDCRGVEAQLYASQGATLSGDELLQWRQYYQALDQRVSAQKSAIVDATNAVEASRHELVTARQQKKMLEKLQSRAHAHYRKEQTYREQRTVDELVTARFHHER